jgi:peptidoglycan-associated lipoprotein
LPALLIRSPELNSSFITHNSIPSSVKKYLVSIYLLLLAAAVSAQPLNRSTPEANKKSAEEAEASNNPYAALEFYEKVYDDSKDKQIAAKIALMNYNLRDYDRAEKGFAKLVLRDRKGEFGQYKYYYAMCLKHNGKYQEAIDVFSQFVAESTDAAMVAAVKREITGCEMAKKAKQPETLLINNIGKKANSPQTESSPSMSGGELYFSSMMGKEVVTLDGKQGDWYAKIVSASKTGTEFGEPKPLDELINREGWHQGNVSVTADGKTMYFTRVQLDNNGVGESKIYYALKGSEGWGAAKEVEGVNGEFIAKHPCEGDLFGERVLFFVANLPGGKGGFDIYYAPKKGDGAFGLPVNLGEVVNTAGEEASPFYRDGKLYFSSNGRPTIGGLDVFESQWNGSIWSDPKPMPMGVNSSVDDLYYTQDAEGMSGYLVSNRPGPNNLKSKTCCDDIYAWEIERIKVELMANTFRLRRKNEKENPPLENCTVQVFDAKSKTPAALDQKTNATANLFEFTLQPDKSYVLVATREGFQNDTVRFNTTGIKKTTKVEKKLTLRTVKPAKTVNEPDSIVISINEPIRLNNIYYDYNKDNILADAEQDLQIILDLMKKYADMKIELSSHTDARGKDDYNENLSQRRAESAKRWLVERGVATDRIVPKGYGETRLLNACADGVECSDDEHRFNRRTEFKIIAGPTEITIQKIEKRTKPTAGDKPKDTKPGGKN